MRLALYISALTFVLPAQQPARFGSQVPVQPEFLANVLQLTTDGNSRKPHWGPDGRRLLIVSAEEGKCPQAYWLDATSKDRKLASSGLGSVRSAAPLFKNRTWIFDSTQDSGAACAPAMMGSVPPEFNIFVNSEKGKLQRITAASGYDAEVDVSFDGKTIVYTSQASGDLEIWTMEADGMNKRQLTHSPGYDGEPNFSDNGQRIVFRSHRARGVDMQKKSKEELAFGRAKLEPSEVYVMDRKGGDEKQITSFGCTVLSPVWAPDNRRVVFSANLQNCAGDRFEMFMVNLDGSGLVQLTKDSKFAGEASFSPGGKYIAFTKDGNIYTAEWMAPAPPPETLSPLSKP